MKGWIEALNSSFSGAALMLCMIGLWFTAVIPGVDRWSKRFFMSSFIIFLLGCLSSILELVFQSYVVTSAVFYDVMVLESLLLSLPLPMQTAYLLHCCKEQLRASKLLHTVLGMWGVFSVQLVSAPFIDGFISITPENQYFRGPLYSLPLIPIVAIQLLNLVETVKRRKRLSRKTFQAFLITQVPMSVALTLQVFVNVYPLIDISYILSMLAMYSFILYDQIEQDRRQQREIARQQREIAQERASVMALQMRPHFIYNTLMSIHSLCRLNPSKAQQITEDFTNYLRKSFNAVASISIIPFTTELEHTRAYLAVEQAQHNDMLSVTWDTSFTHFRLPPLTLQPIVENAVKHGLDPDAEPLRISIKTRRTKTGTEITVEDTGPGFDPNDENKPHTTLTNIRQRLEMMCGGDMTIQPRNGGGTVVIMSIP